MQLTDGSHPDIMGHSYRGGMRCRSTSLAFAAAALMLVAGCGAEEKKPAEPIEFEETLGFSGAGIIERQSRVEGEIRGCMQAQGFDYIPVDPLVQERALTGKALTEEEFIKQFGEGISTLFDRGLGRGGRRSQRPDSQGSLDGGSHGL